MERVWVEAEGRTLAAWTRPGSDPPVVLLHGLGADAHTFDGAFAPGALPGRRLVALDLPGHGSSPLAGHPCTMEGFADTVVAALDALGVGRHDLVAHSMGGAVGVWLAECSDVGSFLNAEGNLDRASCFFSGPIAAQDRERFVQKERDRLLGRVRRLAEGGAESWRYYAEALARCDPEALHRSACALVDASSNARLLDRYIALPCPTLYVVGSENARSFPGRERLAAAGRAVHVVTGGHFMMGDSTREFYEAARSFLGDRPCDALPAVRPPAKPL